MSWKIIIFLNVSNLVDKDAKNHQQLDTKHKFDDIFLHHVVITTTQSLNAIFSFIVGNIHSFFADKKISVY